jgi:hypothetical protein
MDPIELRLRNYAEDDEAKGVHAPAKRCVSVIGRQRTASVGPVVRRCRGHCATGIC